MDSLVAVSASNQEKQHVLTVNVATHMSILLIEVIQLVQSILQLHML